MKRRSALAGMATTVLAGLGGKWSRASSADAANAAFEIDALHPISVARAVGTLQSWHWSHYRHYGSITDILNCDLAATLLAFNPLATISASGDFASLRLHADLAVADDRQSFSFVVGTAGTPDRFYMTDKNIIYKGTVGIDDRGSLAGQFVGRPIDRWDLNPEERPGLVAQVLSGLFPVLHARGSNHTCCCTATPDKKTNCENVAFGCISDCKQECDDPGDTGHPYCCVHGFEDCTACCAGSKSDCDCVYKNKACTGTPGYNCS